jgi:magnesium-transporting ATPase (P-type)
MSRDCNDANKCDPANLAKTETSQCAPSTSKGSGCRYKLECGAWGPCMPEGIQYRKCLDMGIEDPDNYCMSTAMQPGTSQRCTYVKPVPEAPLQVCNFPYIWIIVFVLSYLGLISSVYRIDNFFIRREEVQRIVNLSRMKINFLLLVLFLGGVLLYHPCLNNNNFKAWIFMLLLFALCIVYVFYEKFDYIDKGEKKETKALFKKVEEFHTVYHNCPFCRSKFKSLEALESHKRLCKLKHKAKKMFSDKLESFKSMFKRR